MKLRQAAAVTFVASLGLTAAASHAESDAQRNIPAAFRNLDRNGDGYLTRSEVSGVASYAKSFGVADENGDGRLSPDEFIKSQSIRERELAGVYLDDAALTTKVKAALARKLELKSLDVHVMTDRGRVLLAGWVDSEAQRKQAFQAASRVSGVKLVKDGMTVR